MDTDGGTAWTSTEMIWEEVESPTLSVAEAIRLWELRSAAEVSQAYVHVLAST
jgi:hypothetical protein